MKFDRLPLELLGTVPLTSVRAASQPARVRNTACWVSECFKVAVISREWTERISSKPCCTVDVYTDKHHVAGFHCARDGASAFVANEALELLTAHDFTDYMSLKQLLLDLSVTMNMAADGEPRITLAQFHRYKERKEAAREV